MSNTARIAELNDALRTRGAGGQVVMTNSVQALGQAFVDKAMAAVRAFADFSEDNDPHGEHDCASVEVEGETVFWKIDYYDLSNTAHSPDPADPAVTNRVLTIMLASDY